MKFQVGSCWALLQPVAQGISPDGLQHNTARKNPRFMMGNVQHITPFFLIQSHHSGLVILLCLPGASPHKRELECIGISHQ